MTSKKMKKRTLAKIITFISAIIVVLAIFSFLQWRMAVRYERRLQYDYEQQMYSLSDYLGEIDEGLKILKYSATPTQFSRISSSIWNNCGSAKACVSALPTSFVELDNTYRFLSQTGEYIRSLSRQLSSGGKLSEEDMNNLQAYSEYASSLSAKIAEIRDEMDTSELWDNMAYKVAFSPADELDAEYFYSSLKESETAVSEALDPIYSGPYSKHITSRQPEIFSSLAEVDENTAKSTAAALLGTEESYLTYKGHSTENDKYTSHRFETANGDTVAVTVKGGLPVYFMKNIYSTGSVINEREALAIGRRFIENLGFGSFKPTYYSISDSVLMAEYSLTESGVTYLTDVIKLTVGLDNGEVIAFDAEQYLLNNHKREPFSPKNSIDEARSVLSPALTVISEDTAVVPLDNVNETLCYEFICKADSDTNVIVFINCDTLEEEDIKIVSGASNGVHLT